MHISICLNNRDDFLSTPNVFTKCSDVVDKVFLGKLDACMHRGKYTLVDTHGFSRERSHILCFFSSTLSYKKFSRVFLCVSFDFS